MYESIKVRHVDVTFQVVEQKYRVFSCDHAYIFGARKRKQEGHELCFAQ